MAIKNSLPEDVVAKLSAQLEYTYQRVADAKQTKLLVKKGVQPLERALGKSALPVVMILWPTPSVTGLKGFRLTPWPPEQSQI